MARLMGRDSMRESGEEPLSAPNSNPEVGGHSLIAELLFKNGLPRESEVLLVKDQDFFQIT